MMIRNRNRGGGGEFPSTKNYPTKNIGSTVSSLRAPWGTPQKVASDRAARDILDRIQEQLLILSDSMYPEPTLDSQAEVDDDKVTEITLAATEVIMQSVREYPTMEIPSIERTPLLNNLIDGIISYQLTVAEMKLFLQYLEECVEDYCLNFIEQLWCKTQSRSVSTQTDLIPPSPASECGDLEPKRYCTCSCYMTADDSSEISLRRTPKETVVQKLIKYQVIPAKIDQSFDSEMLARHNLHLDSQGRVRYSTHRLFTTSCHHDSNEPGTSKEGHSLSEKTVSSPTSIFTSVSEQSIDVWEDSLEEQPISSASIISSKSSASVAASTQSSKSDFDQYLKNLPTTYSKIERDKFLGIIMEGLKEDVKDRDSGITFFSTTDEVN